MERVLILRLMSKVLDLAAGCSTRGIVSQPSLAGFQDLP
jgi:hypothetical protein